MLTDVLNICEATEHTRVVLDDTADTIRTVLNELLLISSGIVQLNGVGDSYSSTTAQLADGMKNVAGVLKISGNTFDQSLAMLAAANDLT